MSVHVPTDQYEGVMEAVERTGETLSGFAAKAMHDRAVRINASAERTKRKAS